VSDTVANLASLLFLGFFLGMRHATDADHVVAIATIVSRQRKLGGSALIGCAWGLGHTITVFVVGSAVILFGVVIPARVGLAMEFAVGIMLVLLGLMTLTGIGRTIGGAVASRAGGAAPHAGGGMARQAHGHDGVSHSLLHDHAHAHGDYVHQHAHGHGAEDHGHDEGHTPLARIDDRLAGLTLYQYLRPLVVGIVHGLAGSAAVALLVLAAVRDPGWAMAYLLLFGTGTIIGMMLITVALAAPFAFSWTSLPRFNWQLRVASGLISFGFGLLLIYEIGFADGGLFTATPTWQPH
jgi:high-affinity nickel permease